MSKTSNGKAATMQKMDMYYEAETIADLQEMKELTGGTPMAELIRRAVKRYIAAEKPKLLARLRAKLLSPTHRN